MKDYTDEFSFVLKPSTIKGAGVGIFAAHGIEKGTKMALNKEGGEHRVVDKKDIPEYLHYFCIDLPGGKIKAPKEFNHLWIVWYINHSDKPNVEINEEENCYYSTKDIKEGEEILVDYNAFNEPEDAKKDYYKKGDRHGE